MKIESINVHGPIIDSVLNNVYSIIGKVDSKLTLLNHNIKYYSYISYEYMQER